MVLKHRADCTSQWATIESSTPKIGCTPQTLLKWIQRTAIEQGTRDRVTTAERERVTALERDVKELRRVCSSVDAWQWLVREMVGAAKH
jgi:transposase-like protein